MWPATNEIFNFWYNTSFSEVHIDFNYVDIVENTNMWL